MLRASSRRVVPYTSTNSVYIYTQFLRLGLVYILVIASYSALNNIHKFLSFSLSYIKSSTIYLILIMLESNSVLHMPQEEQIDLLHCT